MSSWEVLHEEVLLDNPHAHVLRETLRTPTSPEGRTWVRVTRKTGVTVAPRLPDGSYVLIREERVPARRDFWQFPAGQVEAAGENAVEEAARRELLEEAGCTATQPLRYMGMFFTSPGFTDEVAHQFFAPEVSWDPTASVHDAEERILEVKAFPADTLRAMVVGGEIADANTLALYARLAAGGWI